MKKKKDQTINLSDVTAKKVIVKKNTVNALIQENNVIQNANVLDAKMEYEKF